MLADAASSLASIDTDGTPESECGGVGTVHGGKGSTPESAKTCGCGDCCGVIQLPAMEVGGKAGREGMLLAWSRAYWCSRSVWVEESGRDLERDRFRMAPLLSTEWTERLLLERMRCRSTGCE